MAASGVELEASFRVVPTEHNVVSVGRFCIGADFQKAVAIEPQRHIPFRGLEVVENPDSVTLLIGPEGDFSAGEYEEIARSGWSPVDLGELVLRTETAVFAMVAAVRYQFQISNS